MAGNSRFCRNSSGPRSNSSRSLGTGAAWTFIDTVASTRCLTPDLAGRFNGFRPRRARKTVEKGNDILDLHAIVSLSYGLSLPRRGYVSKPMVAASLRLPWELK
jgi:hypothetical protein